MALINCSECNNEISKKATSCPQCGCPNDYEDKDNNASLHAYLKSSPGKTGLLIWGVLIILVSSIWFFLSNASQPGIKSVIYLILGIITFIYGVKSIYFGIKK